MRIYLLCVFSFLTVAFSPMQAAEPTPIQALNNYASFINESVHGMVIVHRLLEN